MQKREQSWEGRVRKVGIPGLNIEVEVNRIGMSGTLAYEIRGLKEDGPNVYHAAYEIGKPMGLKRLGWRSYPVNHAFGGYPCSNCKISIK